MRQARCARAHTRCCNATGPVCTCAHTVLQCDRPGVHVRTHGGAVRQARCARAHTRCCSATPSVRMCGRRPTGRFTSASGVGSGGGVLEETQRRLRRLQHFVPVFLFHTPLPTPHSPSLNEWLTPASRRLQYRRSCDRSKKWRTIQCCSWLRLSLSRCRY